MATEKEKKKALNVYEQMCTMLDNKGFKYTRHDDDLVISCTVRGEDIPMDMLIFVHEEQQLVRILSPMPFDVPEDKRFDMAVAVCVANYGIIDGSSDYDLSDGDLRFRLTSSFRESILSEDLLEYMFMVSAVTTDRYNDKFMMLAKGMMSIEQFIEQDKA